MGECTWIVSVWAIRSIGSELTLLPPLRGGLLVCGCTSCFCYCCRIFCFCPFTFIFTFIFTLIESSIVFKDYLYIAILKVLGCVWPMSAWNSYS